MSAYPPVRSFDEAARLAGEYFMGKSPIHEAAEAIARALAEEGIDFAVAGALALNEHGVLRATEDVDLLITREGLARFKEKWLGRGFVEIRPGGKPVRHTATKVRIDFLISGDFPGDGKPKPVAFPLPAGASEAGGRYPVLSLPNLIELKLAAAMTAPDRPRDYDDVIRLIRARNLPDEFQQRLSEYVRAEYARLWNIAQKPEDEY
ncbi:MAG: nucleotidyl transferase AbiEii/AbiGii toxin family protein [Myxococcales bacterium]|nr:nucleotidyl transferase AbiEii/AbiGii toxin family protein [Myxococcales bacterium]